MGRFYSKKLIFDYVSGNDLGNYDIDKLENDVDFMKEVIEYTNDKNFIHLCGDDVLNNYDFVKYIINKFRSDKEFVIGVADDFLSKNDDEFDYDCAELNIIMGDIIGYTDDFNLARYNVAKNTFFCSIMLELSLLLKESREQGNDDFDLGFAVIQDMFLGRYEMLDFFASKFIDDILYEDENQTFEERVHDGVKDFCEIKRMGINNYLISFLDKYDRALAGYVANHIYLLKEGTKSLNRVGYNWDNYVLKDNFRKFTILEKELSEYYMDEERNWPSFTNYELLDYILIKMNLLDEYQMCFYRPSFSGNVYSFQDIEMLNEQFGDVDKSLVDYRYYRFGVDLASELFEKNIIDPDRKIDNKNNDGLAKIIKFSDIRKRKRQ